MKTLLILFKHTFNIVAFPFIYFGLSSRSGLSHIKKGCGPSGLLAKDTACARVFIQHIIKHFQSL